MNCENMRMTTTRHELNENGKDLVKRQLSNAALSILCGVHVLYLPLPFTPDFNLLLEEDGCIPSAFATSVFLTACWLTYSSTTHFCPSNLAVDCLFSRASWWPERRNRRVMRLSIWKDKITVGWCWHLSVASSVWGEVTKSNNYFLMLPNAQNTWKWNELIEMDRNGLTHTLFLHVFQLPKIVFVSPFKWTLILLQCHSSFQLWIFEWCK